MKSISRQNSGFVLLSVMFSVTLLLTCALAFAWFAKTELKRVAAEAFIFKSRCAAEAACDYAMQKINEDKNGYDAITEQLYSPEGGISMDMGDYKLEIKIRPLNDKIAVQGLFLPDGNTLRNEYEYAWKTIWQQIGKPQLAPVVLDFMDKDDEPRLDGAERKEFLNRPVFELFELKLLNGVTDADIFGSKKQKKCLKQFISTAGSDKININVATAETLSVLDKDIGFEAAKSLVSARLMAPFERVADLKKQPGFSQAAIARLNNVLSTESTHFELRIKVAQGAQERIFKAIVQRGANAPLRLEE